MLRVRSSRRATLGDHRQVEALSDTLALTAEDPDLNRAFHVLNTPFAHYNLLYCATLATQPVPSPAIKPGNPFASTCSLNTAVLPVLVAWRPNEETARISYS